MRILHTAQPGLSRPNSQQRGAALMLALLVLFVLIMIVFQISMTAGTDRRVASNELYLTKIDRAIESAMLKVFEDLKEDAATGEDSEGAAPTGGLPGMGGGTGEGGGEDTGPTDSKEDTWGRAQQTEINGISLRILVQDEDSKLNVLTMLTEDADEAEKAFQRVVRVLDLCREMTEQDIDEGAARDMAEAMREFLTRRDTATIPQPVLLTDEDEEAGVGMPLTLREFLVLDPFEERHFRDYRDSEGVVVHSIASFLTVSTSLSTYESFRSDLEEQSKQSGAVVSAADSGGGDDGGGSSTTEGSAGSGNTETRGASEGGGGTEVGGGGAGAVGGALGNGVPGIAVNINTAPSAVLHAIMDRSEIDWTFLDEMVLYRNEEEEGEEADEDAEPIYDEYGQEIVARQVFDSLEELKEVDGWDSNEPIYRDEFQGHLTVESGVFSIFITGRFSTRANGADDTYGMTREEREAAEELGTDLTRTVRCTVWRYKDGEEFVLVPLERWEVLDYRPFEVLDFPDEGR